ncbi:hypothetical protein [Duncaniella muris]|uniref:hypothetical protein n=1 Tax=Duncaniella muris TaxID=2094150 RepID=UPI003F66BFED
MNIRHHKDTRRPEKHFPLLGRSTSLATTARGSASSHSSPDREASDTLRWSSLHHLAAPLLVRRLASKVTVAFDGSELYNDVQVYVTDIYLKDIQRHACSASRTHRRRRSEAPADNRHTFPTVSTGRRQDHVQKLPDDPNSIIPETACTSAMTPHSFLGAYLTDKTMSLTLPTPTPLHSLFSTKHAGTGKSKQQDAIQQ